MVYTPSTSDSFAVIGRRQREIARAVRESLKPSGSQYAQTTRKTMERLSFQEETTKKLEAFQKIISSPRALTGQAGVTSAVTIPQGKHSYAPISYAVPDGVATLAIMATATITVSGGSNNTNTVITQVQIGSSVSPEFTLYGSGSMLTSSISHAAVVDVTPGQDITISLLVQGSGQGERMRAQTAALVICF